MRPARPSSGRRRRCAPPGRRCTWDSARPRRGRRELQPAQARYPTFMRCPSCGRPSWVRFTLQVLTGSRVSRHQLHSSEAAVADLGGEVRRHRLAPAVGGRARVEQLRRPVSVVACPTECGCARRPGRQGRETGGAPGLPAGGGPGLVHHAEPQPVDVGVPHLRKPRAKRRPVVVAPAAEQAGRAVPPASRADRRPPSHRRGRRGRRRRPPARPGRAARAPGWGHACRQGSAGAPRQYLRARGARRLQRAERDVSQRAERDVSQRAERDVSQRAERDVSQRAERDVPQRDWLQGAEEQVDVQGRQHQVADARNVTAFDAAHRDGQPVAVPPRSLTPYTTSASDWLQDRHAQAGGKVQCSAESRSSWTWPPDRQRNRATPASASAST